MDMKQEKNILELNYLNIVNKTLHIEGKDNFLLSEEKFFYFCKSEDKIYYPNYFNYSGYDLITIYENLYKGRNVIFNIQLESKDCQSIEFFLSYNGHSIKIFPFFGKFTHIPNILNGYYNTGKYMIKFIEGRLNIYLYNEKLKISFEKQYCKELLKKNKMNIIRLRKNYFKYEDNNNYRITEIWIINDRPNLAGDNGEYFFRFLKKIKPKHIKYYFVIKKNCYDFERLKPLGNILDLESENYLYLFLNADKIISSVSESWVDNPFGNNERYLRDLFHFEYIFIQHGIIKDDLSEELNRIKKNFNIIITSSKKEYESLLNEKYGYNRNNVLLTGLPRYDNLQKYQALIKKEKIILLFPTWRMYIQGTLNTNTYEGQYSRSFNLTYYYNYFNNLINNDKLIMNMKVLNYTGRLCLHPYFSKQWKDFKNNDIFSVLQICDYQKLILKSSLLVTDYSSVFFDFAFLKKPIIYTQFDYKEYRNNHYKKGYFDYQSNGFGPVCFDFNCTIDTIISYLENDCLLKKKYLKRINKFFGYNDGKNCERLYLKLNNSNHSNIKLKDNNKIETYNIKIFFAFLLFTLIKLIIIIYINIFFY